MKNLPASLRLKLPFVLAGFVSFLFSVWRDLSSALQRS